MSSQPRLTIFVLALTTAGTFAGAQDTPPPKAADLQKLTNEWVLTRKLISEEKFTWQSEKSTISDLNAIRAKEAAQLDEFIKAAGARV
ncbi:MAG: hypothetical protein ABL994_03820, partial [Verrucomicrobiales bacterium]